MPEASDGYQVGNAFIQMLPSFRSFHTRTRAELARIGDVHINVEPEVSTKKAAAAVAAMDARLSKTPIVKKVELDDLAARAKMAALNAKHSEMTLRIDADISAALAKIAALEAKRGKTSIDVDAEIAKAQAKIRTLEARRDHISIQVDVDSNKAEQALHQLDNHLNRLGNNRTDINMEAGDASRALALIGLITAGLSVVGQLAPAAAAAIATIPAALFAAAQGVGAVVAGLSGISDATKAMQAVEDNSAASSRQAAQQRVASTKRVASAQSSLERALEQADRSAVQGAREVKGAREGLADAQVSAVHRVQDAERSLASAQVASRDAQEALTRARKDAAEKLEDLGLSLSGAALDEQAAVLAVERAQNKLNLARESGVAGLDMAEIELGAKQAVQSLAEVRERYGDLRDESADATRVGVDGSQEVVAAQRQVGDAADRARVAEADLVRARVDGAREVSKAQERVAQAQEQVSQAVTDASRAVADAQRALGEAAVSTGAAGSAATDKLAVAMGKLTPAGREFATFLQNDVKPALHDVGDAVQATLLPRLEVAFGDLLTLTPQVSRAFAETGEVIGDLAMQGSEMVTSGPWRADFESIMKRNNRVVGDFGGAGLSALDAIRNLTIASGPLVEALAASTEGYAQQFKKWIQGKRDSGELATWFQEMSVRIKEAFATFGQIAGGIYDVLKSLAPLGHAILDIVGPFIQWVGAMLDANPVLATVIALGILGTSTFVSFFRTVGGLTQAFRTSTGVYKGVKDSIFGIKQATDQATTAAVKNADAQTLSGTKLAQTGGVVGKLRGGLDEVRAAYGRGAAAGDQFTRSVTGGIIPAVRTGADTVGRLVTATSQGMTRASGAVGTALDRTGGALKGFASGAVSAGAAVERGLVRASIAAHTALDRTESVVTRTGAALKGLPAAIKGVPAALERGIIRASIATDSALTKVSGAARGVQTALNGGLIPAALALDSNVTRAQVGIGRLGATLEDKIAPATGAVSRGLDGVRGATGRVVSGLGSVVSGAGAALSGLGSVAGKALGSVTGVVTGTVAAVSKGVGGMLAGLTGALGGPFGIAIIAATVGLGALASAQADAAQKAAEHKAAVQSLTDALVESGGAVDESIRKQVSLSFKQKSIADNARQFGLNVGDMITAVAKGGGAAKNFEHDLSGVSDEFIRSNGLTGDAKDTFVDLEKELIASGGSARDHAGEITHIADSWQAATGASKESRDAFRANLDQLFDLVGGYRDSKGEFDEAVKEQQEIAQAQYDAMSATDRHTQALKRLQDQILGQLDADLAQQQSLQTLSDARDQVTEAYKSGEGIPAALLAENQAILEVIRSTGQLGYTTSTATTEIGKWHDATTRSTQAAVDLANTYSGPLPRSLQDYLEKLTLTKDETGNYTFLLNQVPTELATKVIFDGKDAKQGVIDLMTFFANQAHAAVTNFLGNWSMFAPPPKMPAAPTKPRALGGIGVAAYAKGGVRPMSSKYAQIVPPNQPRLMGDRMHGDEGFIPINTEPRSVGILTEVAARMGFGLIPLAVGALLALAGGGVVQGGTPAAATGADAALTVNSPPVDEFTAAVQALITSALAPLADEVTTGTTPALLLLEDHAGHKAVDSVGALSDTLPPLRTSFALTAAAIGAAWSAATQASQASVTAIGGYLATLRYGIGQTGTVFGSTADWIGTAWARIRKYTADPVRAALAGPYNSGLIPAWNYLNNFFSLNRPLSPVAIPFAVGGQVPGVGNQDNVPALLTPGEYVVSKPVVKKWGLRNLDAAHMAARRGGFPGLEGMLAGDGDGIYRVGFSSGGPVPEALARATRFGKSMHGKPYVWGGSSEAGTDCSGWMAMLARALVDEKPYARREWATASTAGGGAPPRFAAGMDGTFAIGVNPGVHTAGTLAGTNVESGGGHGFVAFGPPSTGADDSQFPLKFHLPDLGGNFVSGGAGGSFNLASFIRDSFNATYQQLGKYQEAWGANMMAQAGAALTRQAADAVVNQAVNTIVPVGTAGNVESWRPLVLQALRMLGLPMDWADITLRRMNQESGGNQFAVNNWDSNAKRGDPSRGLMQVIGSTFRAYRDTRAPDNVLDPLANVLASMKYATARYGSLPAAYGRAGGYDDGGYLPVGYSSVYNGLSRPEMVLTDNQWSTMYALAAQGGSSGGAFQGNLYLSSGEFLGVVEGAIERANSESGRVLARRIR